jgi:3',5'-cyclic AMP phosphodiesterase CpdA
MTEPLVIAHLSDLHLGADVPAAVASIADEVAAFEPDLTVVSGDHTMRARPSEFLRAADLLDKLPAPRLVIPGNHDLPLISPLRVTAPYARYRRWIGEDNPVVRIPGLTALGINSMPPWRWKSGRVTPEQAVLIQQVLGQAPPADVRLLALHHPPFAGGPARLVGRSRLSQALQAAQADVVLFGHTHVPAVEQTPTHLLLVNAGTATSYRTRNLPRSWTLLRIHPTAIEALERFESTPGTWHTGRVIHLLRR